MRQIKFTACKHLDFDASKYTAKLALIGIGSGGTTKLVWERKDIDDNLQLCQFCKLNGRHNFPDACLDDLHKDCNSYEDFEHAIDWED
jgi:hypothetical protein